MFIHPYLARERQRDMLAQADQQRLVRRVREFARASRREEPTGRRMTRAFKRIRSAALPS
jgi:hypothetical protein